MMSESGVMQRGFPQAILIISLHFTCRLFPTPCSVRWLGAMCSGCFSWCRLRMPWGAKEKSTEIPVELPEVSDHFKLFYTITRWHTAVSRNWKVNLWLFLQYHLLRMLWSQNQRRWDGQLTSWDLSNAHIHSEIDWKLTERRSNKKRLRYGHRERSSNPGSICSFGESSSVSERGH